VVDLDKDEVLLLCDPIIYGALKGLWKVHKLDRYPYETYYEKVDAILERDNYTCQVCGLHREAVECYTVTKCLLCEELARKDPSKKGLENFHPEPDWRPPKPCPYRGVYKKCGECPMFRIEVVKRKSRYPFVVHHLNGEPRDNDPENLVTVCVSCHHEIHGMARSLGRLPTLEEAREHHKKWHRNK